VSSYPVSVCATLTSLLVAGLVAAYIIKLPIPVISRAPPPAPRVVPIDRPEI
jgi:hypothetical protein